MRFPWTLMPFAIARIAKLKKSNVGSSGMHVSRSRLTLNADRSKLADNQTLIHNNDAHLPLSQVVDNKIHSVNQNRKIRTDAVHLVEILWLFITWYANLGFLTQNPCY